MRVVEPQEFSKIKKPRKKSRKFLKSVASLSFVFVLALGGYYLFVIKTVKPASPDYSKLSPAEPKATVKAETTTQPVTYKTFTPEEFNLLYKSTAYPNTTLITEPPTITGNVDADARIRMIAEKRGYTLKSIPVASISKTQESGLEGDDLLQPLALAAWQELKTAAAAENIPLTITSGYRSPEYQRNMFVQRLLAKGANVAMVAAGQNDGAVETTLLITAPPGYSRHHTGYTLDLWCKDGSGAFVSSKCFDWLKQNNYLHAKEHGWIPSYPDGAPSQGPEPEPWEYVWVGKTALTN